MNRSTDAVSANYTATLPTKRMGAAVLFFDEQGRVLIVEPTYKDYWEIPGGAVEADESPHMAACREIKEELGLVRQPGSLLAVDWVPPRQGRTEGLMWIFDGGMLSDDEVAGLSVPPEELSGFALCTPDEAALRLSGLLGRRLTAAVSAREAGTVAYLENGNSMA